MSLSVNILKKMLDFPKKNRAFFSQQRYASVCRIRQSLSVIIRRSFSTFFGIRRASGVFYLWSTLFQSFSCKIKKHTIEKVR